MSKSDHFLFYSTDISANALVLNSDEVAHLTTVLRFGIGDEIIVTDGAGTIFECRIEKMKRDNALCSILSRTKHTRTSPEITLYVGAPDRDRMETLCDELPPLGITRVVPMITDHCQKSWWGTRWFKSQDRFERKIIASIKQSHNPFTMVVEKPVEMSEIIDSIDSPIIFADFDGKKLADLGAEEYDSIALFIGSPGGFSEAERSLLQEKGTPLALGTYRLRTELAATAAVSLLNQLSL